MNLLAGSVRFALVPGRFSPTVNGFCACFSPSETSSEDGALWTWRLGQTTTLGLGDLVEVVADGATCLLKDRYDLEASESG